MKASIETSYTLQIMVVFILLFVGFLSVYINFNKTFKIKNEVIDVIERSQGLISKSDNSGSLDIIKNYLNAHNHTATRTCPQTEGWYGYDLSSDILEIADENKEYSVCIRKVSGFDHANSNNVYYEVALFFKLSVPGLENLFTFAVEGETIDIERPNDNLESININ